MIKERPLVGAFFLVAGFVTTWGTLCLSVLAAAIRGLFSRSILSVRRKYTIRAPLVYYPFRRPLSSSCGAKVRNLARRFVTFCRCKVTKT